MGGGSTSPPPELGSLRVATPSDILLIGILAAAGFPYSPLFRWERPKHEHFADDTLLSYRSQFKAALKSDECIVLVQEDAYEPEEDKSTEAIIPAHNGWTAPKAGERVVLGVLSFRLEPNSPKKGQLKSHDSEWPEFPDNPGRNLNRRHYDSWGSLVGSVRNSHCIGDSIISMIVVHLAY